MKTLTKIIAGVVLLGSSSCSTTLYPQVDQKEAKYRLNETFGLKWVIDSRDGIGSLDNYLKHFESR